MEQRITKPIEEKKSTEWQTVRLGDVAQILMGQSPPGSTYNELKNGLPFFQGVTDFTYKNPTPRVYCTEPTRIAFPGDILFSVRAPIGRVNIANIECAIGRGLAIVRPRDREDLRYLEFILRSVEDSWHALEGSGSVFGNAKRDDLEGFKIRWPEKNTRNEIASILGSLDDIIELNRQVNETLEQIAQALFKTWFVDFDPVRAKAEGRDTGLPKEIADLFPDSFEDSELGGIPKGWRVSTIGEEVRVVGGSTPSTTKNEYWENGANYWATPKDLSDIQSPVLLDTDRKITDAGLEQISSGLLPIGTVLLSSRAPIGYLAISEIPVAINQGFIAMICDKLLSSFYVQLWTRWNMEVIKGRANGTTFQEISKSNFRPMPILVPPQSMLDAFNRIAKPLHGKIVTNLKETRALADVRDTLLPELLSGGVRV